MRALAAISVAIAAAAQAQPSPSLDMQAFFSGRSHSENVLKIALKRPVPLIVDSVGRKEGAQFVLVDSVREGDKPLRQRKWVMRAAGANRFVGTLSDAVGPVEAVVSGNRVAIRYEMKGGLKVSQLMQLRPDGRTMSNSVVVRKFGIKFATVEGTIRKLD